MSNTLVGNVYQRIIEEVTDSCATTFEEDGVGRLTLDELKQSWQKKLSDRHVAAMPWDPAPTPAITSSTATTSNAVAPRAQAPSLQAPSNIPTPSSSSGSGGNVYIKNEPSTSYDLQNLPPSNALPHSYGNSAALQRAGQQLTEKFGPAARAQVDTLQARAAMVGQPRPQNGQQPAQMSEEQRQQQHRQYVEAQHRQQYQNMQKQRAAVKNGQTDGASEWDSMVAARRAAALGSDSIADADMTIRQRVEQMGQDMEGGGLLLPLSQRKRAQNRRSKASRKDNDLASAQLQDASQPAKIRQFDGGEESDDDSVKDDPDEDAINSDLDDPDDDVVEDEDDEGNQGEVMLCTYDKVQRVKNKWKCIFRDGILTTGGNEYLFNRATAEVEW